MADSANLVPDALQSTPQAVLWLADAADATLAERLAALQAACTVPVALVCASIDDGALAAALTAGLHACSIGAIGATVRARPSCRRCCAWRVRVLRTSRAHGASSTRRGVASMSASWSIAPKAS